MGSRERCNELFYTQPIQKRRPRKRCWEEELALMSNVCLMKRSFVAILLILSI